MRTGSLGAIVLICASFAIAVGTETASLTVSNQTPHVVTVVVADKTFPDVAPGTRATYQTSSPATVRARVSYAPGQDVQGSAERSFHLSSLHAEATSGTTVYFACQTGGMITSPASGGPVTWSVTADTLAVR